MKTIEKARKLIACGVPASTIYKELNINCRTLSSRLKSGKEFKEAQIELFNLRWGDLFPSA